MSEDGYIESAPELVAEIAAIDPNAQVRAHRRNGVREYLVWQTCDRKLEGFTLQNGEYVLLQTNESGIVRSSVLPGLWLTSDDLLAGDMARVLLILQQGLAASEQREFVWQCCCLPPHLRCSNNAGGIVRVSLAVPANTQKPPPLFNVEASLISP